MITIELASGLIAIGRPWGAPIEKVVPSAEDADAFLRHAIKCGITFFDTAPSYGSSEERLGRLLNRLTFEERSGLFIATKCGEFWHDDGSTSVDHSYGALMESVRRSLRLLGPIDLLQIHKSSFDVLRSADVQKACKDARALGITHIGASVSDQLTGLFAAEQDYIDYIQLPFNADNKQFLSVIEAATKNGKKVIINRPLAMGKLAVPGEGKKRRVIEAFQFLSRHLPADAVVLTGTANKEHLDENIAALKVAQGGTV